MHIYDTLIIGSSYFSVGYAMARKNCIICEENQTCDTQFYLPLRSFRYVPYIPKSEEGEALYKTFCELSLFSGDMQNTNGFECGLCKFLMENTCEILLKCRVIDTYKCDDFYDVRIQTNEGVSHLYAKHILSTKPTSSVKYHTTLFVEAEEGDFDKLTYAFPASYIEKAFYDGRYALYTRADNFDENKIKHDIYNKWSTLNMKAKILYMAPTFVDSGVGSLLCDADYKNPIEAFEGGYFYAKEGGK